MKQNSIKKGRPSHGRDFCLRLNAAARHTMAQRKRRLPRSPELDAMRDINRAEEGLKPRDGHFPSEFYYDHKSGRRFLVVDVIVHFNRRPYQSDEQIEAMRRLHGKHFPRAFRQPDYYVRQIRP